MGINEESGCDEKDEDVPGREAGGKLHMKGILRYTSWKCKGESAGSWSKQEERNMMMDQRTAKMLTGCRVLMMGEEEAALFTLLRLKILTSYL